MSRAGLRSEQRPSGAVCLNTGSSSFASRIFVCIFAPFLLSQKDFWNLFFLSPTTHIGAARCRWIQLVSCAQCFYRCTLFSSAWPSWTAVQPMRAKKVKLGENTLLVFTSFASLVRDGEISLVSPSLFWVAHSLLMFVSLFSSRLREIQRCWLQRSPAELLLRTVLSELDQHHQGL